jgi:hypothetical protein
MSGSDNYVHAQVFISPARGTRGCISKDTGPLLGFHPATMTLP